MNIYKHALVLIHDEKDGAVLLRHAAKISDNGNMKITLGHISFNYLAMNYISDSRTEGVQSREVIEAKSMFSKVVTAVPENVDTVVLVTLRRFDDVEKLIHEKNIDLVIAGHTNRFLGIISSRSLEFINHLDVDVLIKHINA
ncbi:universal stress protein [Pectobacteriaceae bacterium CE90]|nr:universal stress protein [Pectobacteriaceae bacterium CE90]